MDSASRNRNLLIIEDDAIYRTRLGKAFEARGYEVSLASNKQEFVEHIQNSYFSFAVIDLRVAELSGLDLLESLVRAQPACRAVILTGYGTIASSVSAIKLGAVNFLTKPTDPDTILQALLENNECSGSRDIPLPTLAQQEWEHIHRVLDECSGNITVAAKILGVHRRSLQRKLAKIPTQLS